MYRKINARQYKRPAQRRELSKFSVSFVLPVGGNVNGFLYGHHTFEYIGAPKKIQETGGYYVAVSNC
jgi:hypothetical protein